MKPLLIALFILTATLTPATTSAQFQDSFTDPAVNPDGTLSSGFVPCSGTSCSACDFVVMANTIIKWLFGIAFLFFAILAIKAGFKLITSGGNAGALSEAKKSFTNAFLGLIIFMAAWLLVDTLLRALLPGGSGDIKGYGPWSEVKCASQVEPGITAGYYPGDPEYDPTVAPPPAGTTITPSAGCTGGTCVPLTIPCTASGCNIAPDMVQRLENMHNQASVSGARVTEAMPPSRTHKSQCHYNGTCVDYSKAGGMTAAEVKRVIDAAYANGLRPVYEVITQAQKSALVAGGVPAANVVVLGSWISAPHFSIYGR